MMDWLGKYMIKKVSSLRLNGICLIITLLIMYGTSVGVPGIIKYDSGFKLLDMQIFYSYDIVLNMFEKLGIEGIQHYIYYLGVDLVFILFLMLFQYNISNLIEIDSILMTKVLMTLTFIRGIFDLIEDFILYMMMKYIISITPLVVFIVSVVTLLKFISLFIWLILIVISKTYLFRENN